MADSGPSSGVAKAIVWTTRALAAITVYRAGKYLAVTPWQRMVDDLGGMAGAALRAVPGAAGQITKEKEAILEQMEGFLVANDGDMNKTVQRSLPETPEAAEETLARMERFRRENEAMFKNRKAFGGIYYEHDEVADAVDRAFVLYSDSNALYPTIFPALKKYEAEVVRMACTMMLGDDASCGCMTSGGTESILMACKSAREWGKDQRGIAERAEIVVPETIHAAFDKAAHYFGLVLVKVPVGKNMRADVAAMRKAVTPRTVLIAGSAPGFPHGIVDDIPAIAQIALDHGILCHVDACLGGFLVPFLKRLGHLKRNFDFSVPGVTSISADIHKFGYGPKGTSIIMYARAELRRYQYFTCANWPGGLYCSPSILGSRAGGLIAGAWCALMSMGIQGYEASASAIWESFEILVDGIANGACHPDIDLVAGERPDAGIVAFTSSTIDIFAVADALERRGWNPDRLHRPAALHLIVGRRQTPDVCRSFLDDLAASAQEVKDCSAGAADEGSAPMYGLAATVPDRSIVDDLMKSYMDLTYNVKQRA